MRDYASQNFVKEFTDELKNDAIFLVEEAKKDIISDVRKLRGVIGHEATMRWLKEEILHEEYEKLVC